MRYNRKSLEAVTKSYEAQRSLTHDFNNQMLTVLQLLYSEQNEEATSYLQTILHRVTKADVAVSTNKRCLLTHGDSAFQSFG